jgi:hypothetical protein
MKALLGFIIFLLVTIVFLSTNTYPDYKLVSLFGFSFGVNFNDYLLIKLLGVTCVIIYVILYLRKHNGKE